MENCSNYRNKADAPTSRSCDANAICQQRQAGSSSQKLNLFLEDSLAKILINAITLRNMNVLRTLHQERNRILKQMATFTLLHNQLMVELEEEVHKKVFERASGLEEKIEGIKMGIEKYELKIFSSEEYAAKLTKALRIFKETQKQTPENLERTISQKLSTDDDVPKSRKTAAGRALLPTFPTSSYSPTDWKAERKQRSKEWRKQCSIESSNTWKVITPVLMKAREKLQALTEQLNLEFHKQMSSIKMPSRSKLLKVKVLEQEIANCEQKIKTEEDHAISIYNSVILSKNVKVRIRSETMADSDFE